MAHNYLHYSAFYISTAIIVSSYAYDANAEFLSISHDVTYDYATNNIEFSTTFNEAPTPGGAGNTFQYFTPDSLIRGPEINFTLGTLPIRAYGPPSSNPAASGWGPLVATVPFTLSGDTLTFSAPYRLFSSAPLFDYELDVYDDGALTQVFYGATLPETSTWAMILLGFAGLGAAAIGRRSSPRCRIGVFSLGLPCF